MSGPEQAKPAEPGKEADTARLIRARGLARDRTLPQIAQEIHAACGPRFGTSRVKAYRLASGVALADVIIRVRALYEIDGRDPPKIGETLLSAYESGHKRPGPEYLHYLCAVYRADPAELGFQGPCVCGRSHGRGRGHGAPEAGDAVSGRVVAPIPDDKHWHTFDPGYGDRIRTRADDPPHAREAGWESEEENVLRRTLLQLVAGAGAALDGHILEAADTTRRRMDDTLASATVTSTMLDQWEETISGYGREYMTVPPLRLLCDVLLDLSDVRRMCSQSQPVDLRERLCRSAAQLAGLAGIILFDFGDHRLSRSFLRTARSAADETGDRRIRAWVASREALVPMYYGDPRESLHLARRAQDLAGRTPSPGAVMAPMVEARALGLLAGRGRTESADAARRAIARGRAVFGQLSAQDTVDATYGFTERQMRFYEGDVYTNLGDVKHADQSLSQALRLYSSADRLDRTLVRLGRASCRLREGEPEESLRSAQQTIVELPAEHRIDIVMHRARQLINNAIGRYGETPAARDLRDVLAIPPVSLAAPAPGSAI